MRRGRGRVQVDEATRRAIYGREDGRCAWCGCDLRRTGAHVDHLVYVTGVPFHERSPLILRAVAACPTCNIVRGACMSGGRRHAWMAYLASLDSVGPVSAIIRQLDLYDPLDALRMLHDSYGLSNSYWGAQISDDDYTAIRRASDTRGRWPATVQGDDGEEQ